MTKTSLLLIPAVAILAGCATPSNQRKLYKVDSINTMDPHHRTIVYPAEYKAPPVDPGLEVPGVPTGMPPSALEAPLPPALPAPDATVPADPAVDAAAPAAE